MGISPRVPPVLKRWFVFNFVGAMGIVVQMAILLASDLRSAPALI